MKIRLLMLVVLFGSVSAGAQNQDENKPYRHAIGVGAGFTTAFGLSYRYTPSRFGAQLNFAPIKSSTFTNISAGLTFLYMLIPGKTASLYLYQGNHYFYRQETTYFLDATKLTVSNSATNFKTEFTEDYFNNGIGFGIELLFARQVSFNLMAGYGSYVNFKQINVTGEAALYFKF